jgi:hypothetical protein
MTTGGTDGFHTFTMGYTCSQCGTWVNPNVTHFCKSQLYEPVPEREHVKDPEVRAMALIAKALEPLDTEARVRVLDWAWARFAEVDPTASGGTD